MTTQAVFSPEEWKVVLEAPPAAGLIVITAARGGHVPRNCRHVEGLRRSARGARRERAPDEIVSAKPKMDHARYHLQGVNHGAGCSGSITAWW